MSRRREAEAAAAVQEDDNNDQELTEAGRLLKQLRSEKKKEALDLIEEISAHIINRGSRSALAVHRKQLASCLNECAELNARFIATRKLEDEQKKNIEKYYTFIEKEVFACYVNIENYLLSRVGEPPSSIASHPPLSIASKSHRSEARSSTSNARLKEARLRLASAELELRQIEASVDAEAESKQRIKEAEARLEELKQNLAITKQRRLREMEIERLRQEADILQEESEEDGSPVRSRIQGGRNTRRIEPATDYHGLKMQNRVPDWLTRTQINLPTTPAEKGIKNTPDAWLFEDKPTVTAENRPQENVKHLAQLKLQSFTGNPKDWPMFIGNFKSRVHDVLRDDAQRITYLRELLAPTVRSTIAQYLQSPVTYMHALRELQKMYGNPMAVSEAYVEDLLKIKPVKDHDFQSLRKYYADLNGTIATLQASGYEQDLYSPSLLRNVRDKLPRRIKHMWGQESIRLQRLPTLFDFAAWLNDFIMGEATVQPFSEIEHKPIEESHSDRSRQNHRKERVPTVLTTSIGQSGRKIDPCTLCKEEHRLYNCPKFKSLQLKDRVTAVQKDKRCFNCLIAGHMAKDCRRKDVCGIGQCKRKHHALLHDPTRYERDNRNPTTSSDDGENTGSSAGHIGTMTRASTGQVTLLSVIPVKIIASGKTIETFALLDNGSEVSLITEDMSERIGLKGPTKMARFGTFHGKDPLFRSRTVNFKIGSCTNGKVMEMKNVSTVPRINLTDRCINWPQEKKRWKYLKDLTLPRIDTSKVTILIGADIPQAHEQLKTRKPPAGTNGPWAVLTPFGWCATGQLPCHPAHEENRSVNPISIVSDSVTLDELVSNFWKTDALGIDQTRIPASKEVERANYLLRTTTLNVGNRYQSGLLWKKSNPELPNNKTLAIQRFFATERKLLKDHELAEKYAKVIDEYIQLGHARKVPIDHLEGPKGKTWYLPHHAVLNPHKPNKVRVVFDASAKYAGTSLNENLLKGPDLLTNLLGVLLRFRRNPVPISADIEKMYHQVLVTEDDRSAFRFIWRRPGSGTTPETYEMQVHVFGAVSSPSICLNALCQTATDHEDEFPEIAKKIRNNFYVDNYLNSVDSEEEAIKTSLGLINLLQRGGFRLTKWMSSSRKVLNAIPVPERNDPVLNLDLDKLPSERTLGIPFVQCKI